MQNTKALNENVYISFVLNGLPQRAMVSGVLRRSWNGYDSEVFALKQLPV